MKLNYTISICRIPRLRTIAAIIVGFTMLALSGSAVAQTTVDLGVAATFGVLSAAGITGTAGITGNVGTTTATIGVGIIASGTTYPPGHAAVAAAHTALLVAYTDAESRTPNELLGVELGGRTLQPGVYRSSGSTFGINGTLTLDAGHDANAVFIFQMASTLTTATGSQVALANGAQWFNVFWQVGSSATLGVDSRLEGNILANVSISGNTDAVVRGRILAGAATTSGAVTLLDNTALPMELSTFYVTANRLNAELFWSTETELNNYGFDVERKTLSTGFPKLQDYNHSWSRVTFVPGAGNASSEKSYKYTDRGLAPDSYAYRIRQIDRDGSSELSEVVEVEIGSMPSILQLYVNHPNPFHRRTTIEFTLARENKAEVGVYNILAQRVATLFSGIANSGVLYQCKFDAGNLPNGVYYVRLKSGNQLRTRKIVHLQ